jgi:hypothetical protein
MEYKIQIEFGRWAAPLLRFEVLGTNLLYKTATYEENRLTFVFSDPDRPHEIVRMP